MPLSDEAIQRFLAYASRTDPSNLDKSSDEALFTFVAWVLVHEPNALDDHFAYENAMRERGFAEIKSAYVHTVIATAAAIVSAYLRERGGN